MSVAGNSIQQFDTSISGQSYRWNRRDRIFITLLAFCTFAVYFRTRNFEFISYDDHVYVFRNVHVMGGLTIANLRWAMSAVVVGNWHPLTLIVELCLVTLFGPSAGVFHLANAFFHTTNVILLYAFLRSSTGRLWPAFFAAGLWGLHPLRVESVTWVSELKDVLCGTLWLSCMLAYLRYSRKRTFGGFALVLVLHGLALTAKPMAATLPAALLLLDYWPLQRKTSTLNDPLWWIYRVLEKLPLLALSALDLYYARLFQQHHVVPGSEPYPIGLRCKDALVYCAEYLRDIFFPHHLIMFHPHPSVVNQPIPTIAAVLCGVLLLGITAVVILRRKVQPYLVVGWFWFLGTLVPVLGFVLLGDVGRADRYTYLPSIGITLAVVWSVADWTGRQFVFRWIASIAGLLAMLMLAISACFTVSHWKDSETLFAYMRGVDPDNPLALTMYAEELWPQGLVNQAIEVAKHATEVAPQSAAAHVSYARALQAGDRLPEAIDQFVLALHLSPAEDDSWDGLGLVRAQQAGEYADRHDAANEKAYREKAIVDFKTAIHLNSEATDPREHLAFEQAALGRFNEAISTWKELIQILPTDPEAHGKLAEALRLQGDLRGAVENYQIALANGAKNPDWESQLSYLVATSPRSSIAEVEALLATAKDACDQTSNREPAALDAYAACLARVGRFDDAVAVAQQGVAQANADHSPAIALGIQKRLSRYQRGLAYVAGDN